MAFLTGLFIGTHSGILSRRSCFVHNRNNNLQLCKSVRLHSKPSLDLMAKDTSWKGKVPPSTVLGIGEKVPSAAYIISSVVCLLIGSYCVYQSNLISPLTVTTINPLYVLGSLLLPYSWGLHVAAWIQLKNGK